jgi:arginyl-tRNA synthetase
MTDFGEKKDRVLRRSTGAPTYLAADVAYEEDKFERGFDRLVYVLGADHHNHVAPLKAIAAALGRDPDTVEVPLLQFVHVVEGGGRKGMSKRKGDFVTLDELIESIGVDAARWFMISRSHDSTIDLDIDLARKQDPENPVYYVQYAHARIASILRRAGEADVKAALATAIPDGLELHASERELIRRLLSFPGEMREAADRRAPHRVATYALELGQAFAAFYRDAPVINAEDPALRAFRLTLCVISQRTLARTLGLLGVSAPDHM